MAEKCALIVDDDRPIRALLRSAFKRHNIECDEAPDGEVAIEQLRKKRYHVVVLDLMMPKVDGFEVIEFLEESKVETPVVVLSAAAQVHLKRVQSPVVAHVMRKPFDLNALTRRVLELCGLPIPDDLKDQAEG